MSKGEEEKASVVEKTWNNRLPRRIPGLVGDRGAAWGFVASTERRDAGTPPELLLSSNLWPPLLRPKGEFISSASTLFIHAWSRMGMVLMYLWMLARGYICHMFPFFSRGCVMCSQFICPRLPLIGYDNLLLLWLYLGFHVRVVLGSRSLFLMISTLARNRYGLLMHNWLS
jgi:hypothetical protein